MSTETVQQLLTKIIRVKVCKHRSGARHCADPRCHNYIGKSRQDAL